MTSPARRAQAVTAALFALAGVALLPGLGGPFLLDDFSTLPGLAGIAAEPGWYSALKYVLGGVASELGRPVALASFAIQAASWDQRPQDFLAVNVALHLLNGGLWLLCLRRLQGLGALPASPLMPVLATALWLLLPMQAATVLYVVQRMTLLATTAILAGLLLYLHGREAGAQGRMTSAWFQMSAGIGVALGFGTLSKETAAVTPLLLLALEGTLLRSLPAPHGWRAWSAVCLWTPAALLVAYLMLRFPHFLQGYADRGFGLGQRLLTEARLLWQYLAEAMLPRPSVRMLYDDYALSTGLASPWTTLAAVTAWLALVVAAIARRATWPLFAFAVAWFLLGHLLESSVIPLEIGFAHRNYLPLLGVTLALAAGFDAVGARPQLQRLRRGLDVAAAAYVATVALCLWLATTLWGQPLAQARHWAMRQPESSRAIQHFARVLLREQQVDAALAVYRAARLRWPEDAIFAIALYQMGCYYPGAAPPVEEVRAALRHDRGPHSTATAAVLRTLVTVTAEGRCSGHDAREVASLLDTLLALPRFSGTRFALDYDGARLLEAMGDRAGALARLEDAVAADPHVPVLQLVIDLRLEQGDRAAAEAHLQTLENSARISRLRRWLYRREIEASRQSFERQSSNSREPA